MVDDGRWAYDPRRLWEDLDGDKQSRNAECIYCSAAASRGAGGTLNDFVVSIKIAECERVVTPIRDVDFVMTVTGDSMAPDYPNGAQVLIKKVDETAFIEWGRVYVLDTCNGSVIKEVRKGDDDNSVQCYSLNPDPKYQPFAVRFADIYGMYRVLMCMSLK